ncbi:GNAT family N-acetyltransferase [Streptomyces sp. MAR4 CNX-425]|uniref:GNAT family N-acetyltransferase n=1 Tax=Streptomyces sp. MAR4 CNX-425 TaxID=3406343 RepID=UPI003B514620
MGKSVTITPATNDDAEQVLKLQYLCYQAEAALYGDYRIPPLTETLDELRAEFGRGAAVVARLGEEVVGAVRGTVEENGTAVIGRLIVHPRLQGHGLGARLLLAMEARLAEGGAQVKRYQLFTGHRSEANLRLYRRLGYEPVGTERVSARLSLVTLEKAPLDGAPSAVSSATTAR